ncbi:l-lactate dehydrogenase [Aspergillus brunneoviolaceus CBS 621.78]|uniref:L-lactate dehydrogenase n=1 Tax=Aspergillus brunneoviolaceus CBS 621.78 TaxID=1450534 RepID=A0ACD1G1T0_9EURO|nr:l-lactate dehydrogenase [Aspergillus brunneoviolaceus CBS 621.78]RAH43227.1 l-lactate dehydrogenase [Aspergillus brunneoviolaceus CBS 621.78]
MTSRIGIIGVGHVGAAAAYALLLQHVARELWLVDIKLDRRDGQVRDLADVAAVVASAAKSPGAGATVRAATHHEVAAECDIIVITAGSKYTIGETSMQHLYRKVSIVRSIVAAMKPIRRDAVLLVVSNPVDLLTSLVREMAGLPAGQVLGTGTELDGVRLRALVAAEMGTPPSTINNLNVLGVHGPSQLATWSTATVNDQPLHQTLLSNHHPTLLADECTRRSEAIVRAKGSTEYGIAAVIARLCAAILGDERSVYAVSHFQAEFGCCFSLPAVVGREGVVRTVAVELKEAERVEMERSVRLLRGRIGAVEGDGVV